MWKLKRRWLDRDGLLTGLDIAGPPGSRGGAEGCISSWWLMTGRVWCVLPVPYSYWSIGLMLVISWG